MNTGLFVLGIIIIVLGVVAYGYAVTETDRYFFGMFTDTSLDYPYRNYGIPLIVLGIILVIIASVIPSVKVIEKITTHTSHGPEKKTRVVVEED